MCGLAVNNHDGTKMVKVFSSRQTILYFWCFQNYLPVLEAIRRQHRHRRICLQQVQLKSKVTNWLHEGGADHPQKPKTKIKKRITIEIRTPVCETFLSGWRSSQIIQRTQEPHAFPQDSDSERPTKVVSKSRKHNIYTHFPKARNCEVCLGDCDRFLCDSE